MVTKRLLFLCFFILVLLTHAVRAQVINEGFEEAAWTSSVTTAAAGNATGGTVNVTQYADGGTTYTGNWLYSSGYLVTNNVASSTTYTVKSGSYAFHLGATNSSFLITPIISAGVTTVTAWVRTASTTAALQMFVATNNTITGAASRTISTTAAGSSGWFNSSGFTVNSTLGYQQITYAITDALATSNPVFVKFQRKSSEITIDDIQITVAAALPPNPSSPSVAQSGCSTTQMNISWSAPSGYNAGSNTILAFLKQGSAVTVGSPNAALATYTASTTFTSGTAYQNDGSAYCIYKGDGSDGAGNQTGLTITGLTAGATYYLLLFNVADATPTYSSGTTANGTTIKNEPTNHPTSFTNGTVTTSNIPLTWTAAVAGTQSPDGYLIQASSTATPSDPSDGTDITDDTNISDGTANVKSTGTSYSAFTGFTAGTMYYFRINSYTNSGTCIDYKASGPTMNAATAPTAVSSLSFSITGGTGTINWSTSGYNSTNHTTLVFVKATSSVTTGTPSSDPSGYTASSALGSGTAYQNDAAAYCVYNGDGTSATVTGLAGGTTYYILVYTVVSAANSNATYSYSSAVTTSAIGNTEYTWIGGASGSWATSTNWSPTRSAPAATDALIFDGPSSITCTSVPSQSIAKLLVKSGSSVVLQSSGVSLLSFANSNGSSDDLVIQSGAELSFGDFVNVTMGASVSANIGGTLTVGNGRRFYADGSSVVTNVSGSIISNSGDFICTSSSKLIFSSTGLYTHNVNGDTIPTATWNTGSTCLITGITSAGNFRGHRQTFSNFVWDCAGQSATHFVLGENSSSTNPVCVIADSFIVKNTNGKILQITSSGGQRDFTVGNFFMYGGKVAISYNTEDAGEQRSLTVNNTFYVTDSLYSAEFQLINQPASQNVTGRLFVKGNVDMHKTATAAYLSNISSSSKGEIQFIGNATQYAKFDKTLGKVDFVINNASGVQLQTNVTTHRLKLVQGNFHINANTLTVAGALSYPTPGTGLLAGIPTSNLTIGAAGYAKNDTINLVKFANGYQTIKNLSLYDTANAVIGSTLNLTAGAAYGSLILDSLSTLTTNDSLYLKSDENGTARVDKIPTNGSGVSLASITGKITVERYLPMNLPSSSRRWRLLTAPVSSTNAPTINAAWQEGATSTNRLTPVDPNPGYGTAITKATTAVNGFDQGSTANPSIYQMVPGSGTWTVPAATNSGKITDNNGCYMVFVRGDRSIVVSSQYINTTGGANLRVKGEINRGRVTISTVAGKQIIGNPYPSTISLNNTTFNGVNPGTTTGSTYYLWDPKLIGSKGVGQWVSCSSNGNNTFEVIPNPIDSNYMTNFDSTGKIESGMAFMIDPPSSGSFIFNESDKVNSSTTIGVASRNAAMHNRPVNISGKMYTNLAYVTTAGEPILADGAATLFGQSFYDAVDEQDSKKLQTFTSKEKLGVLRDNIILAVERRKKIQQTDTIFLHLSIEANVQYQLQFKGSEFDPSIAAILEDKYTGQSKAFNPNTIVRHNFTTNAAAASFATDRFRVVFLRAGQGPLRVKFTYVGGQQNTDNTTLIQWNVADEINVQKYVLEFSKDGTAFAAVGSLHAAGTSAYQLATSVAGDGYFRVIAVDQNGKLTYSKTIYLSSDEVVAKIIPVNTTIGDGSMLIDVIHLPAQKLHIKLMSASGQELMKTMVKHPGGTARISVPVSSNISTGVYILSVAGERIGVGTYKIYK